MKNEISKWHEMAVIQVTMAVIQVTNGSDTNGSDTNGSETNGSDTSNKIQMGGGKQKQAFADHGRVRIYRLQRRLL